MTDERSPVSWRTGELLAARYRLLEPIDRAGFGGSWRARDERAGRDVEVHELGTLRAGVSEAQALEGLRAIGEVKHRALATTHDVFAHAGAPCVVLASTDGVAVTAWVEERARAGLGARLDAVRAVVDQVAQGLTALHRAVGERGAVHGALGAPCVRVEKRGSLPSLRVEAQGWAAVVAPPAWWKAPVGGVADGPPGDVFALALLTATLLVGELATPSITALRRRFEERLPEVDPSLVDALAVCIDEDPARRPPDGRAARDRLLGAKVSWQPRERPVVEAPPRRDDPQPPTVAAEKVQQVRVVAVTSVRKEAVTPRPAVPPPVDDLDAESTVVEAPSVTSPVEEPTDLQAPRWDDGDEVTAVAGAEPFGAGGSRRPLPHEVFGETRVIAVPDDESTDVAGPPPVEEELTEPIGEHVAAFARVSRAGEHTMVPGGRPVRPVAFVADEPTAPMSAMGPPPAERTSPMLAALVHPKPPTTSLMDRTPPRPETDAPMGWGLVVGVAALGVLLGLVLWWVIR